MPKTITQIRPDDWTKDKRKVPINSVCYFGTYT